MANTTNFNWETPDDTDLVKDGAAAIRTLGSAIDTSLVDLKGGTTGQILSKATGTDMDFTWITNDVGDITAVSAGTGISGGGTSGSITITNDMATTITASGDIVVGTGSGTYDNLPIGTTGQVLTADTTVSPYKVKWAAASGGASFVGCLAYRSTSLSVSYNVWTSVPFDDEGVDSDSFHSTSTNTDRITIPTGKGGKYLINAQLLWDQKTSGSQQFRIRKNGSSNLMGSIEGNTGYITTSISQIAELTAGDYITVEAYSDSSGGNTIQPYMDRTNFFQVLYLGA